MQRREFLAFGVGALAAAGIGGSQARARQAATPPNRSTLDVQLSIEPADVEMITGEVVFQLLFVGRAGVAVSNTLRPVLRAIEGETLRVRVTNNDGRPHAFAIPGAPGSQTGPIPPGGTAQVSFVAPQPGSYLYLDPTNAPVFRLVGLQGVFVVRPRNPVTPAGSPIPYSQAQQTRSVQLLFDALGTPPRFPGNKWDPNDPERERIWLFTQIDPTLNAQVDAGRVPSGAAVTASFLPRFFTINGLSGFDLSHVSPTATEELHHLFEAQGRVGQPTLIRTLNAGLVTHSPHIHGNHTPWLTLTGPTGEVIVRDNIPDVDTWTLAPLGKVDVLLPIRQPPDIPVFPMRQEPFPLRYPMHCHTEMSQTAAGGNYPQGAVLHWEVTGPLGSG
ncbi:multicopper oxidase domain-containing protein [Caulobacter sp. 17J65-9]|uniref:multicopper oxidase domain-containing protein n=1 Tax=Caulobacter sp. 17J65-9 TaxID=2709382 RepID=UPI0013C5C867|nr:multicopper oxidase domain-containing protein [Caulobacter sp. 17J65-9]NEX95106.1 multicopper oxidase domain-containing protein [Caulobacter sp. 17J65-9]